MADEPRPQPARKNPSLLACIACRRSHMKCNGKGPVCDRCVERGVTCVWVESRRGIRPTKRDASSAPSETSSVATSSSNQASLQSQQQPQQQRQHEHPFNESGLPHTQLSGTWLHHHASIPYVGQDLYVPGQLMPLPSPPATSPSVSNDGTDVLLDLFYKYFHPSHPFVLPSKLRWRIPEFLKAVMRFGGSHFAQNGKRDALKDVATQLLLGAPQDAYKVQAFALLAMVSFSRTEQQEGQAYLKSAIDLALWMGLNQKDFAVRFGENDTTLQESWRRTWWDLFIVEGLIASFTGQRESSILRTVKTDVLLPGDCESYNACSPLGNPRSFEEMQDRAFSDEDFQWPSFAYKIEAMHLLYSVGALSADTFATSNSEVETLDQRLSNFRLSLPSHKRDALKVTGEVDEVMFGALMTANYAEIELHRPRSSLVYIRNHYRTLCTPEATQGLTAIDYHSHDAKAIRAANAMTNLLTVPSAPILHTPCFTCALTVATTVQLPAMVQNRPVEGIALKERIQLAITAMGSISEVWPMALATKSQVASFAREILRSGKEAQLTSPPEPAQVQHQVRPQTITATPTTSEPSVGEALDPDSFVANQDWLMDLIGGDGGFTASELDAWLQNRSDGTLI